MKTSVLPENILKCLSPEDRKKLGKAGQTASETIAKAEVKNERDLQGQIVNLLRLRGIEVLWHRTDRKSAATVGWPDLTFCTEKYDEDQNEVISKPCVWEVKMPEGSLSSEQEVMQKKLILNGWRYRVIRSLDQAKDELRRLG